MKKITILTILLSIAFISGCAGKLNYVRPNISSRTSANYKIIDKPRDIVWNESVPELGKQFFVINNLDRSSGLINLSYSGDPEKYIDCGQVTSFVKNLRGERTYDFPGSKAEEVYEIMQNGELYSLDRKMSVEGRVNLIFEVIGPNQTRVTANTRYVVQKNVTVNREGQNFTQSASDTISFNSGGSASFPDRSGGKNESLECMSNGELEREILSAVN